MRDENPYSARWCPLRGHPSTTTSPFGAWEYQTPFHHFGFKIKFSHWLLSNFGLQSILRMSVSQKINTLDLNLLLDFRIISDSSSTCLNYGFDGSKSLLRYLLTVYNLEWISYFCISWFILESIGWREWLFVMIFVSGWCVTIEWHVIGVHGRALKSFKSCKTTKSSH